MLLRSVLCSVLLLAVGASSAVAARDRCNLPGRRTVALTPQIRVFQAEDDGYYHGCLRRTGKQTVLWEQDDIYISGVVRAVAGRFVAYEVGESPGCKADCPPDVHGTDITSVTDLRSGRTRDLRDGPVWALRLRASGAVAWTDADGRHSVSVP
jgi:hypothetical protein